MKAETWLPILTLVLGWAGAQVTEVLKDRRASNRERQARQAELQRTTLLALQDVLLDLTNLVDKAAFTLSVSTREHPNEEAKTEAAREEWAARRRLWEATSKARLLVSRVEDDEARKQATLLLNIANGAGGLSPGRGRPGLRRGPGWIQPGGGSARRANPQAVLRRADHHLRERGRQRTSGSGCGMRGRSSRPRCPSSSSGCHRPTAKAAGSRLADRLSPRW